MSQPPQFSLEFFPPKTSEGAAKLRAARRELAVLEPAFCSVTYGAGGSTREGTLATVLEIRDEGMVGAPHISCIGSTREGIREVLARYRDHGIHHVVALRGDLPSGSGDAGDFRHANELVGFIRDETGDWFQIEVAAYPECHPQARSPHADLGIHEARTVFRRLRRRNSALDPAASRGLWRRCRVDPCLRARCRDADVRGPARARGARAAFLHAEPGGIDGGDLAPTGAQADPGLKKRGRGNGDAPLFPAGKRGASQFFEVMASQATRR